MKAQAYCAPPCMRDRWALRGTCTDKVVSLKRDLQCLSPQASFWYSFIDPLQTDTAGSDVVQSGRPIFDDFFQHLWPYIGNNTANVVFQMVKRL
ncbi:hypothetical protein TNCV_1856341 [Trichonephila clavipes]|nr:hypothetical protein TNCV_1856341 [Trichonephila clavipes]